MELYYRSKQRMNQKNEDKNEGFDNENVLMEGMQPGESSLELDKVLGEDDNIEVVIEIVWHSGTKTNLKKRKHAQNRKEKTKLKAVNKHPLQEGCGVKCKK